MGFYSSLPCLVTTALLLGLASTPLLRSADAPPTDLAVRVGTIDGLRGLLALAVFFHHAAIWHQYIIIGEWRPPPSRFYANLGPAGVSMFFMITGYLFWSQMLKTRGRPNFLKLYVGRLFRIVPLYLVLALIVLVSVGFATHWRLNESPFSVSNEVARWLAGGVLDVPDVNAYHASLISASVTWSLSYEWMFYASLIVTAFFARNPLAGFLLPLVGLITVILLFYCGYRLFEAKIALLFSVGMIAAAVREPLASAALNGIPQWALSAVAIGAAALAVMGFDGMYGVRARTAAGGWFPADRIGGHLVRAAADAAGPATRRHQLWHLSAAGPRSASGFQFSSAPSSLGRIASGPLEPRGDRRGGVDGLRDLDAQPCRAARYPGRTMGVGKN